MVAHQVRLSMGFSRQEYWSRLPCPLPGDLPNPGVEPRSPTLQADSLPAEPQGKLKNTGVGSLSLLQWIFPTQESNRGSPAFQADSLPTEPRGKPCGGNCKLRCVEQTLVTMNYIPPLLAVIHVARVSTEHLLWSRHCRENKNLDTVLALCELIT